MDKDEELIQLRREKAQLTQELLVFQSATLYTEEQMRQAKAEAKTVVSNWQQIAANARAEAKVWRKIANQRRDTDRAVAASVGLIVGFLGGLLW